MDEILNEEDGYMLIKDILTLAKSEKPYKKELNELQKYYNKFPDIKKAVHFLMLSLAQNQTGVVH